MEIGTEIIKIATDGYKRIHIILACSECQKPFAKPKRFIKGNNNYCSTKCMHDAQNLQIEIQCTICEKTFRRPKSRINTKSGLNFCSRLCKEKAQSGEVRLLECGFYKDGSGSYRDKAFAYYHHECEWCKSDLIELLDVHHLDHDRTNNIIENLIILCVWCHAIETRRLVLVNNRIPIPIVNAGMKALEMTGFTPSSFLITAV